MGADRAPHIIEGPGELRVAVADDMTNDTPGVIQASQVAGLLGYPGPGRVGRDPARPDPPPRLDLNEEQDG